MPLVDATHVECGYDEVVFVSGHTKVADSIFVTDACPTCGTIEFIQWTSHSDTVAATIAAGLGAIEATGFPTEPDLAP